MNLQHPKLIRKPEVLALTGFSKSTLYNRINNRLFVPPISIGPRAVAFVASEVEAVIGAMIEELPPEQIKQLVSLILLQRKE